MPSIFTQVKPNKPSFSKFNLSNQNTLTMDFGQLIPVYTKRVYPGDIFRMNTTSFIEFMPMISPIRADIDVFVHHFFVPYRLIWDDFEDFITGGKDGKATPLPPVFNINAQSIRSQNIVGSLYDYLNIPQNKVSNTQSFLVSSLKFRAYQQIFNDYYRDENLSDEVDFSRSSGTESGSQMSILSTMRYRAWRKDYFTSALPFAQRGGAVQVQNMDTVVKLKSLVGEQYFVRADGSKVSSEDIMTNPAGQVCDVNKEPIYFDPGSTLGIDGGLFTINDLRNYARVQQWLEMNARGGSRYIEQILMHFNVIGDDARLQRAEYLGGGKSPVMVYSIRQTSETTQNNQLGEQAGYATGAGGNNGFTRRFKEHGIVMSIASVIPKSQYFEGIEREDLFTDKFDWYFPEFAHLGEQPIHNAEIMYVGDANADDNLATFGYAPRYAELRYKPNEVHGQMRSTLLHWHLARKFVNRPVLNENFIRVTPDDAKRVFSVTDTSADSNHLIATFYNNVSAIRPLPRMATPKII